jgi:hypothetical protein
LTPFAIKAAKETSTDFSDDKATAPLGLQQLKIQQPGGHGGQSAGLQFAGLQFS